ncbi:MAG: TerB N-terminal domain-containing protein, partial [Oscillospiraceae bacterium]|nr:TerB N-terminal domain-containing protein [Oscillospiraceae bacterium]
MGDFKKFIPTSGKSFEEIKRAINEMVNRVVDTVVDDVTQFVPNDIRRSVKGSVREARKNAAEGGYKPEKIPPRFSETAKSSDLVSRDSASDRGRIHYPHEARSDLTLPHEEQMLERIAKMRELEICVRGQGIVKRAVELTMVEQGEFMADVEDDFTRRAFCALPQPVYAAMSNSQLRTFFTWRTDVRRRRYSATDKPYVLLYCYELLNKIGVKTSVEAFDKLLEVWENCRSFAPYLNALMPRWLKDFYVFNDVTEKYPDIHAVLGKPDNGGAKSPLFETFSDIESGDFSGKFDFLAANSAYNIKESIFFSEQTKPLIEAACESALNALDEYFAARNIELSELVCGKLKKDYSWVPFKDAIVNLDTADGFRPVKISPSERYCVKRGEPALE